MRTCASYEHGTRDFDHLPLGNRQVADAVVRIDVDVQGREQCGRPAGERAIVDESNSRQRLAAEKDVLGDRHRRHQIQFLMNHRDAASHCDAAAIRRQKAGDDVHQRRLAGAVFPHQRVDRARTDLQRYAVKRKDAGKRLPHALHFKQIVHEAEIH